MMVVKLPVAAVAVVLALLLGSVQLAEGATTDAASQGRLRSVAAKQVAERVQSTLRAEIEGGGAAVNKLMSKIEEIMFHTFQAMPKTEGGRVSERVVRYMAHNYFAREHGWLLKGLEPVKTAGADNGEIHEVSVLQEKAPALVQALFEARGRDHGFSFDDVVAMIATLEQLILEESNELLRAAYLFNSFSATEPSSEEEVHQILRSFLLLFRNNEVYNTSLVEEHLSQKALYDRRGGPLWRATVQYEKETVESYALNHELNHASNAPYTFEMLSEMVLEMTQQYGRWQHQDCMDMKQHMMKLHSLGASGRIPLRVFEKQPRTGKYSFVETAEELREHGALDESKRHEPQVLIANYLGHPSNCITDGSFFSVCCLSECEMLMNSIEGKVKAASASPQRLLNIVGNLSSTTVHAPRELSRALKSKMQGISDTNGGSVPLHGRLFAQWMHYAYPAECPYPRSHADATVLTASQWMGEDEEEHQQGVGAMPQWSDEEILPLVEPARGGFIRSTFRILACGAACIAALRLAVAAVTAALSGVNLRQMKSGVLPTVHNKYI
eukprot:CAMPEP_0178411492 /NCGR_PEP_ID=MMETSP0689_2-20121128/21521_1 /TAXON_ID=160604 /ORGANISM="Amphidinium massartii, Strain CS-259" /LENGTH=554 /DNA_ID=CAMNT_0020032697 /DNA_START=58 /DNA_END=1722 /DNA_ORIENTATION=-